MTDVSKLRGAGTVIAKRAEDFSLLDQDDQPQKLKELLKAGPLLLVFYPGDFTPVCTAQLCNYRDSLDSFAEQGLRIFGISPNSAHSHREFRKQYDLPFTLLSDPGNLVAKKYGCTSIWMFGKVSRAVFIVNTNGIVLYRYVEPTILSRRKANELSEIIAELKKLKLL